MLMNASATLQVESSLNAAAAPEILAENCNLRLGHSIVRKMHLDGM